MVEILCLLEDHRKESEDCHDDADDRQAEVNDQRTRLAPGLILLLEKIHQFKLMRVVCLRNLELYLGGFADFLAVELEKGSILSVTEHAGEEDRWKSLLVGIVGGDGVVECLAGKRDLVLG